MAATTSASSERLSLATRLAFGAGDLGPAIATIVASFFQLYFLTTIAGLPPGLAGTILLIVKIWDAVNDPIIGWLTDKTQTRWGRRRPWLLFGAAPFGLLFFLQWVVPPFDVTGKFIYYLIIALLFDTAFTVVNVPYTALTPELTRDYDERTALNSYRFAFSIGGSLLGGILHQIIVGQFADQRVGYLVSGAVVGVLIAIPFLWCFFGTRERYEPEPGAAELSLLDQIRYVFKNRPFLFVVGIYMFSWLAVQVTSSVLTFFIVFWLGSVPQFPTTAFGLTFGSASDLIPIMLFAVQGSALVFLFVWSAVSRRVGKKAVYMIGSLIWIGVQAFLFFLQPEQISLAIVLGVIAGAGVATAYLIPWSMMPDVIELDELETGQRREGMFYGFMVLLQKMGLAIGLFLVGQALQFAGFNETLPPGQQPESALLAIRLLIGPMPTLILICGMILTAFYPITKASHVETLKRLEALRQR
ncbi:MFS transporter [Chloroflexus aggregans]|uniref:Sugar (Glycoside-Pentoside-Hexuronide) transporter n=1 Tax=Chloroflexus aggregans (strain MD-66 / DSM 9485) TaxID=326427 RepID=B8G8Q1_CHLAD|nr:MFS transporter [Chloroflexus aggregans]ACL24313.1 sugar (Glycoside-Pentoside-Hexuronide) transporter [Chloroflexus aggregans DSM 9485]